MIDLCKDTFEWGDYINEKVIDEWIAEENSAIIVAESEQVIGFAHICLLSHNQVWVEGIRIDSRYRRKGIASDLIQSIVQHIKNVEHNQMLLIVSEKNIASQRLMLKNNFREICRWNYINIRLLKNIEDILKERVVDIENIELADEKNIIEIFTFLNNLKHNIGYNIVIRKWRWHHLTKDIIKNLILQDKIIIQKDKTGRINEIAILDTDALWERKNFQISFMVAKHTNTIKQILYFIHKNINCKVEKVIIFFPYNISNIFYDLNYLYHERFILYKRDL